MTDAERRTVRRLVDAMRARLGDEPEEIEHSPHCGWVCLSDEDGPRPCDCGAVEEWAALEAVERMLEVRHGR